jgi:spore maturation protein SpmA
MNYPYPLSLIELNGERGVLINPLFQKIFPESNPAENGVGIKFDNISAGKYSDNSDLIPLHFVQDKHIETVDKPNMVTPADAMLRQAESHVTRRDTISRGSGE